MNHTPQIKKAIQFAARKHNGHKRLGVESIPYVTHLFSVALLVAEESADEDVIVAALLHDTIEDTQTTHEELVETFNERVAELVQHVTEQKELPWDERHDRYLEHLETAPDDALLIAIADKVDNIEDKLATLIKDGPGLLEGFTRNPHEYVTFYGKCLALAERRLPELRLTKRLAEAHGREKTAIAALAS